MLLKQVKRDRRCSRIRAKISWVASRPRLNVYRSNTDIYAQLIDDEKGITICSTSSLKAEKWSKVEQSFKVWEELAKKALEAGIKTCVFDRWGFAYAGRVKALADAARQGGLEF